MDNTNSMKDFRNTISLSVTLLAIGATVVIGIIAVIYNKFDIVIGSLLPLWGTWMGTVLAYYFGKENFEAVSRSYQNVINRLTPEQKLSQIIADTVMIKLSGMKYLDYNQNKDKPILEILRDKKFININRFPVLVENNIIKSIIHRSIFNEFITNNITPGESNDKLSQVKLEDFFNSNDENIKKIVERGSAYIKAGATLYEAKVTMDAIPECQDIIITQNGKKDEPLLGWITNIIISDNAKV